MMFLGFVLVVFFSCGCFELDDPVIDTLMIEEINSDPNSGWVAGRNAFFEGKTYRDVMGLFSRSITPPPSSGNDETHFSRVQSLPEHYDTYEKYPECKIAIRNQGMCGDDYAFSASDALSDRICVSENGTKGTFLLAPQISCDSKEYGCQGGSSLDKMWEYVQETGLVTEKCLPYTSQKGLLPEKCPYKCTDETLNWNNSKHRISKFKKLNSMEDILKYGSFVAAVNGYQDFMSYKSGVYYHRTGGAVGGHVMKVQAYWNCALAWTKDFGLNGYMWFLRGKNECSFESYMYSGYV